MKNIFIILTALFLANCATIVNDPEVPIALSFSDGSSGSCDLSNKRVSKKVNMPGTHNIRRSDDALVFDCETDDGILYEVYVNDTIKSSYPKIDLSNEDDKETFGGFHDIMLYHYESDNQITFFQPNDEEHYTLDELTDILI